MSFSIRFLPDESLEFDPDPGTVVGMIEIGDFRERFQASLSFWSPADYVRSWRAGLEWITGNNTKSCLITSMYDPQNASLIVWWPMYRDGENVWIQNYLLLLEEIEESFAPDDPYPLIPDRVIVDEEGQKLSEWHTTVTAVKHFLENMKQDEV